MTFESYAEKKFGTGASQKPELQQDFEQLLRSLSEKAQFAYYYARELIKFAREKVTQEEETTETLKPEQIHDPIDLICDEIDQMGGKGLVAFGEDNHHGTGTLEYETTLIESLHKREYPIKKIFLEEDSNKNPLVDEYYKTGVMPKELEQYLYFGFVREERTHSLKLELVMKAKELDIPTLFIDNNSAPDRDTDWATTIEKEIGDYPQGLYILIAGRNHVSHSQAVFGGEPTIVSLLDKKYPDQILSINCQTLEPGNYHPAYETVEVKFQKDLEALGITNRTSAVRATDPPFKGKFFANIRSRQFKTEEGFDILMAAPGEHLHTPV